MKELNHGIFISIIQNGFYEEFVADVFFFIPGGVPEKVAVLAYKVFNFRTIHLNLLFYAFNAIYSANIQKKGLADCRADFEFSRTPNEAASLRLLYCFQQWPF